MSVYCFEEDNQGGNTECVQQGCRASTDLAYSSYLRNSSMNESGVVVGGKRDPLSAKFGGEDTRPYVFQNGQFSTLPLEKAATVVAMNDEGEVLFKVGGRKFGLLDKTYREIECGKE